MQCSVCDVGYDMGGKVGGGGGGREGTHGAGSLELVERVGHGGQSVGKWVCVGV